MLPLMLQYLSSDSMSLRTGTLFRGARDRGTISATNLMPGISTRLFSCLKSTEYSMPGTFTVDLLIAGEPFPVIELPLKIGNQRLMLLYANEIV